MALAKQEWKKTWRSLKRQGLVDSVVEVLGREGVKGLTMDNVALHAGVAKASPVGRVATPDDVAEAALALVRNRYVSGEIMVVDGAFTQVV